MTNLNRIGREKPKQQRSEREPKETFWQAAERLGCCHYPRMCETCPMRDWNR